MRISTNQTGYVTPSANREINNNQTIVSTKTDLMVECYGDQITIMRETDNRENRQFIHMSLLDLAQCFDAAHKMNKAYLERELKTLAKHVKDVTKELNALA